MKRFLSIVGLLVVLAACSNRTEDFNGFTEFGDYKGHYKIGNPYQIRGVTYVPRYEPNYDKTGLASWYGPTFHGKRTANGDKFNQHALTAAHPTLPLPSLIRVTNLENGKTLVVMVNDRGPFARGRILDVSQRAAQLLGFERQGVAKVRVQYLQGQTDQMLDRIGLQRPANTSPVFRTSAKDHEITVATIAE